MSDSLEEKPEDVTPATPDSGVTLESDSEKVNKHSTGRRTNRTGIVAIVAVIAITGVLILVWVLWRSRSSGAGRPVPAPRNIGAEQPGSTTPSTERATISVDPEAATRAGIKTEPVGEALLAGGAVPGQVTTGVVQANAYRTTPVISLVGGIVRRVNAELGQNVRQGQTMAVVFSDELAMAQSRYLNALAELDEHHKHHARTLRLLEIGAASREEMEQATTKLRTAESEVASQRQRLLLLGLSSQRIAGLRSPSQVNSEVTLPAPVSGTVISRAANPGEVIAADKEILRIADLSSVWVMGQVYEKDLGKVVVGSGASITSDAYPGRGFRGRVSYIDPTLDPATRTAQARIELANPGQALKIGMFVNVAFAALGGTESTALVIPKSAVQNINSQQVVFVETAKANTYAMRPLKLGPEVNGQYPVLEGLTAGERVVTDGSFLLRAEWLKTNPPVHSH
ncbi:MAG: efflux RND transporter periplasmic adaptor subunit [Pyrinomonadaceae bacterium]|nr:efflux RND transporter periplasmic adaptor subunit [Pyrinomonadaceae bacterium]